VNVELNGTRIFYTRHGRGLPVLTMHGPGFDHTMLRPWLDPLADSGELIYYDHRGTGRSRREEMSGVTDSTWTEDAEALRQTLGLGDVIVFGHSYGGCLAQKYALTYPEHVRGLILCATMPVFDFADVMMANARARGTPEQFGHWSQRSRNRAKTMETFAPWTKAMPIYFHRYDAEIGAMLSAIFCSAPKQ
jgi:proline iminopeptidase